MTKILVPQIFKIRVMFTITNYVFSDNFFFECTGGSLVFVLIVKCLKMCDLNKKSSATTT